MWAYYLESKMYHERYGGSYPTFGTSFWFRPQILRYLEEKGVECSRIFDALTTKVTSLEELERTLTASSPNLTETIELIFDRYR
jgi:hypothetical protein